jgi:glycerol-3-phosphate O-acyltransferase / dihydroxyacetone phosphate acyltransferase
MWLLPALPRLARFALRVYYRLELSGSPVAGRGPVLLVANHPNSLLDPAFVVGYARRPVRFLAKAPLFRDAAVGWLVRGAGAVPVYRAMDDPSLTSRNEETFRAVHAALAEGAAVGIFPEGVSHSEPSLVPLRTGAARIALGAAELHGAAFPIVPIGITLRQKERFRSAALVLAGEPVEWSDLATAGRGADAVRELTRRIEAGLREVTVNLDRWEDAPLVEGAVEVWSAERGGPSGPGERVGWIGEAAATLGRLRRTGDATWAPVAEALERHLADLQGLGFRPGDLGEDTRLSTALGWTLRKLGSLLLLGVPGAVGAAAFWIPYRLTGALEERARPDHDVRATFRVLAGSLLFLGWLALLATLVGVTAGRVAALAALLVLPLLGLLALLLRDGWSDARFAAARFVRLRRGAGLAELRERQRGLADRLAELRGALGTDDPPAASTN